LTIKVINQKNPQIYFNLGIIYPAHFLMKPNLLLSVFSALFLVVACDSPAEGLFTQAKALLDQKQYARVVTLLAAKKSELDRADLWNMLGFAYLETDQANEALASFNQAIKLDNTNYKYFYNRGNAYLQLKQPDEALKDYDQALALDQAVYDLYLNRASVLAAMHRHKEALADFNRAASMNQTDRNLYFNRGQTYLATQDFAKAAEDFHRVVELAPDFARAHHALGLAELQLGEAKAQEACAHLQRALELGFAGAQAAIDQNCGKR